jgi:hypothetical protein
MPGVSTDRKMNSLNSPLAAALRNNRPAVSVTEYKTRSLPEPGQAITDAAVDAAAFGDRTETAFDRPPPIELTPEEMALWEEYATIARGPDRYRFPVVMGRSLAYLAKLEATIARLAVADPLLPPDEHGVMKPSPGFELWSKLMRQALSIRRSLGVDRIKMTLTDDEKVVVEKQRAAQERHEAGVGTVADDDLMPFDKMRPN